MFVCSRCGASFSARHIGVEDCPRCRLRDKVQAPLAFKPFDLSRIEAAGRGRRPQAPGGPVGSPETGQSTNANTATPSSIT